MIAHDPGLYLTPAGQRLATAVARIMLLVGFALLTVVDSIPFAFATGCCWLIAAVLANWVEHSHAYTARWSV